MAEDRPTEELVRGDKQEKPFETQRVLRRRRNRSGEIQIYGKGD